MSTKLKDLKIQSSALKRTLKELSSYKKELKIEQDRLDNMKSNGEKEKIRQQKDVVEECRVMIPNTKQRLDKLVVIVKDLIESVGESESEDYLLAKEIYQNVLDEFPEYEREEKIEPEADF